MNEPTTKTFEQKVREALEDAYDQGRLDKEEEYNASRFGVKTMVMDLTDNFRDEVEMIIEAHAEELREVKEEIQRKDQVQVASEGESRYDEDGYCTYFKSGKVEFYVNLSQVNEIIDKKIGGSR